MSKLIKYTKIAYHCHKPLHPHCWGISVLPIKVGFWTLVNYAGLMEMVDWTKLQRMVSKIIIDL